MHTIGFGKDMYMKKAEDRQGEIKEREAYPGLSWKNEIQSVLGRQVDRGGNPK